MSITAKVTTFFASGDDEGWTESFYITGTDIATAASSMTSIIPKRADLLSTASAIEYVRISDVAVKGDSLVVPGLTLPIPGNYTSGTEPVEANTALNIQIFGTALIKNRLFLRGLTVDVVGGRAYQAPTAFATAFTTWQTAMIAIPMVCKHRTSVGPPPVYSYTTPVTALNIIGATARKPGRPFGLPVGRRRVP